MRIVPVFAVVFALCGSPVSANPPDTAVFSSTSNLVLVPVTVTDHYGKTITGLQQEHFRITDNSAPREIVSFGRSDAPVSLGIIMDLSSSMHRKLPYAVEAAQAVIKQLNPEDMGYLVTFDKTPQLRVPLTNNFGSLSAGLVFPRAEGNTALFDAIHLGLRHGRSAKEFRKVLLVISDGGDNRSRLMESEIVSEAIEADTQIYCIGVHELLRPKDEVDGARFLDRLAHMTGGLKFDMRSRKEVAATANAISTAMRDQYIIGFRPPDALAPNKWRKVRVQVNHPAGDKVHVSARTAYYNP